MVNWFSSFWRHFYLVKQAKCAVSRHFRDNVWEELAEISHVHLYLVISPETKEENFSTWKLSSCRAGCIHDYNVVRLFYYFFCYYRPTKTIAFHNTTKGGCLSGRIVIIISLMYNQILYDNKQPNDMLWSSLQMWSWLHPYSVGFILRQCAPTVGFIPKYSWLHHPRFSHANISAALAN